MTQPPRTASRPALLGLVGWILVCLAVELSGVTFLPGRWYAHLHKAAWTPPSYLFAPVWTLMYILMAIAAWLVWRDGGFRKQRGPLSLFLIQLALNGAWSFICFRRHDLPLSVLDMALLWLVLAVTTRAFFKVKTAAGWILLSYLVWVSFAASLNVALWRLNA